MEEKPIQKVLALFDFEARKPGQLSFKMGDIITVLSTTGNWWFGRLGDKKEGEIPSNYVKTVESYYYEVVKLKVLFRARALYDYNSERVDILTFKKGDVIYIVKSDGEWWEGVLGGKKGLLPSNYVERTHHVNNTAKERPVCPVGSPRINVCESRNEKVNNRKRSSSTPTIKKALVDPRTRAMSVDSSFSDRENLRTEKEAVSFLVGTIYRCPDYLEVSVNIRFFPEKIIPKIFLKDTFTNNENVDPLSPELTLSGFVEEIVMRSVTCKEHQVDLIYAHRYLGSSEELLGQLSMRYDRSSGSENVACRIINFLSEWIRLVPRDFASNYKLIEKARKLIEKTITTQFKPASDASISAKVLLEQSSSLSNYSPTTALGAPPTIPAAKTLAIAKISPVELARQLTIEAFRTFKQVSFNELCSRCWGTMDMQTSSPNIAKMVSKFRDTFTLVTSEILSKKTAHKRKSMIKHFLETATECKKLQNYGTMMEIVYALCSPPLSRLGKSWSKSCIKLLNEFLSLGRNNFMGLRLLTEESTGPAVPFIGELLGRLFMVENFNKTYVKRDSLTASQSGFHEYSKMCCLIGKLQQGRYALLQSLRMAQFVESISRAPVVPLEDAMKVSCALERDSCFIVPYPHHVPSLRLPDVLNL